MKRLMTMALLLGLVGAAKAQTPLRKTGTVVQPDPAVVNVATDDFVFGSLTLNAGAPFSKRFFFDKSKAAFRAGEADPGYWDLAQLGDNSFAIGVNTTASGYTSFAGGSFSSATGGYSFAFGIQANASGNRSFALGETTEASAEYTYAFGKTARATAEGAQAYGTNTNATGQFSLAMGYFSTASGYNSAAIGNAQATGTTSFAANNSKAFGDNSVALGHDNRSVATNSVTVGSKNIADFPSEFVAGRFNDQNPFGTGVFEYPLFVVGNGFNQGSRDNAIAVLQNGDVIIPDLPSDFGSSAAKAVVVEPDGRLRITNAGPINTDNQTLSFNPTNLELTISNGNTVTLIDTDTDDQTLSFDNTLNELTIIDGNTVIIPDDDQQTLAFNPTNNTLTISNGNSVVIPNSSGGGSNYNAGQGLFLNGSTFNARVKNGLRIDNGDNSIRLGGYLIENTEVILRDHTMSFSGDGAFIVGANEVDNSTGGLDNKMFFDTRSGAFRSGVSVGANWDRANLGGASFSAGQNTLASGHFSFAGGIDTRATEDYSFAFGYKSNATELGAVAMGHFNTSSGQTAIALGNGNSASGAQSFSAGNGNNASGLASTAIGNQNIADGQHTVTLGVNNVGRGMQAVAIGNGNKSDGDNSVGIGYLNVAEGERSFAGGSESNAKGFASTTFGNNTIAYSRTEVAMGSYNTTYNPQGGNGGWNFNDRILVVGRGFNPTNRRDAFTVFKSGDATLAGTLTQSSDERLKTDIKPLINISEKLNKINGYTYHWTKEAQRSDQLQYGVIAQEVMKEFPELVKEDSEGFYGVNYSGLVPVLLAALKEEKLARKTEINSLKNELAALRSLIEGTQSKKREESSQSESGEEGRVSDEKVILYPNPVGDELFLKSTGAEILSYQILSLDGKVVKQQTNYDHSIDTSAISSGTYIINIIGEKHVSTMRFVKQ